MSRLIPAELRPSFPSIENNRRGDTPLRYLDNAATSLKPQSVIDAISRYYSGACANVHRGKHRLSELVSEQFEESRRLVAEFMGAHPEELVFTKGATESLNLVAAGLRLSKTDRVVCSSSCHNSAVLPFMAVSDVTIVDVDEDGFLQQPRLYELLSDRSVKALVIDHVSNVSGVVQDVGAIAEVCKATDTYLIVDGAQSAPHLSVDVMALGCDFFAFSAHKMLGPTGLGGLWIHPEVDETFGTYQLGGGTIDHLDRGSFALRERPFRYEAGTPPIASVLGFAESIRYLRRQGMKAIEAHSVQITNYFLDAIEPLKGKVRVLLPASRTDRLPIFSIEPVGSRMHPDDLARMLSEGFNIMVRSGRHCADMFLQQLNIATSLRCSFYLYNGIDDVDAFVQALDHIL